MSCHVCCSGSEWEAVERGAAVIILGRPATGSVFTCPRKSSLSSLRVHGTVMFSSGYVCVASAASAPQKLLTLSVCRHGYCSLDRRRGPIHSYREAGPSERERGERGERERGERGKRDEEREMRERGERGGG